MSTSNTNTNNTPLILIDGSSYLFRAFYALPNLTSPSGQPTGAILGVINMLRNIITQYNPEYIAVIFDTPTKNFRHEIYPAYKANRSQMPEALIPQIQPIFDFIQALGIKLIKQEGIEADDLIATLAHSKFAAHHPVLISSGDKDLAQLVNHQISIIDTMKNQLLTPSGVFEKFGVHPEQMIDYLALLGDSSDNIPGVPGVGPKTAVKWLAEYHSLAQLIQNSTQLSGKVGENFRAHLKQNLFDISLRLLKLDSHIPTELAWPDLKKQSENLPQLTALCEYYGFKSWLKNLSSHTSQQNITQEISPSENSENNLNLNKNINKNYITLTSLTEFKALCERIQTKKYFAIDTETTGLNPLSDDLVGLSFCLEPNTAYYLPIGHLNTELSRCENQLTLDQIFVLLKSLCEDPAIEKIGHHLKFDLQVLKKLNINLQGPLFDTLLASYILEAGQTRHNLETLCERHLDIKPITYEGLTGKGVKQICFNQVPIHLATQYAAEDADVTYQLAELFKKKLAQLPDLEKLFQTEEIPMLSVLARMEMTGVLINPDILNQQSEDLATRLHQIETEVFNLTGEPFNLNSPKQLQEVLFNKLQLSPIKKTSTGQASTNEEVLQQLADIHPVPKLLLDHRHLSKLKSTYTDKLPQMINPETKRVHTKYHQALVITGRLSSSDPNLQNIPIKSPMGRKIRQAFIAPPEYLILSADYSQIELRIMAHLSQDPRLIQAFQNQEDIHQATASEVFNTPLDQITPEQRRRAKAVNFGLLYGMSAFGLAKQLGIERTLAQQYIKTYFERYPYVKNYMETIQERAKTLGYVETLFHRRLSLPDLHSKNHMIRQAAERAAINAPMQGTAADIIKRAMIRIDRALIQHAYPIQMTLQVHDELVFEVKKDFVNQAQTLIREHMSQAATLSVPLEISINTGINWDEAH